MDGHQILSPWGMEKPSARSDFPKHLPPQVVVYSVIQGYKTSRSHPFDKVWHLLCTAVVWLVTVTKLSRNCPKEDYLVLHCHAVRQK